MCEMRGRKEPEMVHACEQQATRLRNASREQKTNRRPLPAYLRQNVEPIKERISSMC